MGLQQPEPRHQATHDAITGLPDRRCVEEFARALALDRKSDLVVVLIGLDSFDASVERDALLKTLAQRVRLSARSDDVVARIGDAQFLVLLTPRIARDEEAKLLLRLRNAINEPMPEAQLPSASARLGVAYCPEDGITFDQLLAQADRRLYTDTCR